MENMIDFLFRHIVNFFLYISNLHDDTNENTQYTDEMVSLLFD